MVIFTEEKVYSDDRIWSASYYDEWEDCNIKTATIRFLKGDGIHTVDSIKIEWNIATTMNDAMLCNMMGKMMQEIAIFAAEKYQLFNDITYRQYIGLTSWIT